MNDAPTNMRQFDSGPDLRWLDAKADLYAGWQPCRADRSRRSKGFEAYVRSDSEGYFNNLWWFGTWWEAMAFAILLAAKHGFYYEGRGGHGIA